jgi:hypothetical protein
LNRLRLRLRLRSLRLAVQTTPASTSTGWSVLRSMISSLQTNNTSSLRYLEMEMAQSEGSSRSSSTQEVSALANLLRTSRRLEHVQISGLKPLAPQEGMDYLRQLLAAVRANPRLQTMSIRFGKKHAAQPLDLLPLQREILFYTLLNQTKLGKALVEPVLPASLWPLLLERVDQTDWHALASATSVAPLQEKQGNITETSVLYFLLREGPLMFEKR